MSCNSQIRPCSTGWMPWGHSLKIGDGDAWPHWHTFSDSLSPIDPVFVFCFVLFFFLTRSHRMNPFFDNSQPIVDNPSPSDLPFLFNISSKFSFFSRNWPEIFVKKCVQICIFPGRLAKICFSPSLPPPLGVFSLNDPLFRTKALTERPQAPSLPKLSPLPMNVSL